MTNEPKKNGENEQKNVLSPKEATVLSLISDNPSITAATIIANTGFSRPTVERAIKKLKTVGKISRIGGDKGGYWKVNR